MLSQGQSQKSICSTVHCSKRSVSEVSKAARDTGKSYGDLLALSDSELLTILSPQESLQSEDPRKSELERLMPEVLKRLKGKHATMQFVHETFYKKQCPDGYGYTQFKLHVRKYRESHDYSYHNDYEPGVQMQIDFAGDALLSYRPQVRKATKACGAGVRDALQQPAFHDGHAQDYYRVVFPWLEQGS